MRPEPTRYNKYEVETLLEIDSKTEFAMERIFTVYKEIGGKQFYYNILRKISFPEEPRSDLYDIYYVKPGDTWTNISYKKLKTISLWWLIAAFNNIDNTFLPPETGLRLKVPTPVAVREILDNIKRQA
mgnify:CR=1 FL=1